MRQDPPAEKLPSGLYVPETKSRELRGDYGQVIAVGPQTFEVRPGDRVMFTRRPDTALIPDWREGGPEAWKDLLVLEETDIVFVVED